MHRCGNSNLPPILKVGIQKEKHTTPFPPLYKWYRIHKKLNMLNPKYVLTLFFFRRSRPLGLKFEFSILERLSWKVKIVFNINDLVIIFF